MANYRSYEDKYGFLKYFTDLDVEFEIVLRGMESLKDSTKWGKRARKLESEFVRAFDCLVTELPPEPSYTNSLYDEFHNSLIESEYFEPCDWYDFRRAHDACIRFFQEVRDAYDVLIQDDRRETK